MDLIENGKKGIIQANVEKIVLLYSLISKIMNCDSLWYEAYDSELYSAYNSVSLSNLYKHPFYL